MSTPTPAVVNTAAPEPQNVRVVNDRPLNVNIITPPPPCDPESHDFKNCNVSYLEDFDFSFNNSILKPSQANPDNVYAVMIFADWCGHCVRFMPEYKNLASMLKDSPIKLCCIDGSREGPRESERNLLKRIKEIVPNFIGFPTIVIFKAGKLVKTYDGERRAEALHKVLKSL